MASGTPAVALFANAELAEDAVEQVGVGGFPRHLAKGLQRRAQVNRDEIEREAAVERLFSGGELRASPAQRILVARGRDQHLAGLRLSPPRFARNGVFQRGDALAPPLAAIRQ